MALSLTAGVAHADIVTWNPSAAGLGGSSFTYDTLHVADYARITVTNPRTGAFSERGFLNITGIHDPLVGDITPSGLTASKAAGGYSLYLAFTATGVSTAPNFSTIGTFAGTFDTLTYSLMGVKNHVTFSVAGAVPTVSGAAGAITLGTGSLISGNNTLVVAKGTAAPGKHSIGTTLQISPAAAPLDISFVPNPAYAGFFVNPSALIDLTLSGAFTNNFLRVALVNPTTITINSGGGDISPSFIDVPEPASFALVGAAMLGLGLLRRRR